jgi:hypothetical protein
LPLNLKNFLNINNIPIQAIYKRDCWKRLCQNAGKIEELDSHNEDRVLSAIKNKWLSTNSISYFRFVQKVIESGFIINYDKLTEIEKLMILMLHYDVWQKVGEFDSIQESIKAIGENPVLANELKEVLEILIDKISFMEVDIVLPYEQPLKLHSRYTRDQILVAFKMNTFEKVSSNRIGVGVAENKELKTELLFIDLVKSEEDFSPTTMYNDYAISEVLFHWQSQNATRSDTGKGLTYINHKKEDKIILLFIREKSTDEYGNTMGYVFIGLADFVDFYGTKPMNIKWKLDEPMPNYLWKESAKMSLG